MRSVDSERSKTLRNLITLTPWRASVQRILTLQRGQYHRTDRVLPTERGGLLTMDNAVDTNAGWIKLKTTFGNSHRTLWPGQLYQPTGALTLP